MADGANQKTEKDMAEARSKFNTDVWNQLSKTGYFDPLPKDLEEAPKPYTCKVLIKYNLWVTNI
jgi:hypothetical protein